jgi:abortive infection bacteriophage resistance protein
LVLGHLNYYRLSGYCLAFETSRHQFGQGTTFEQVEALYEFDRVFRDLVADAIEVVEIDLRTVTASHFAHRYGAFGHADPANFYGSSDHAGWIEKLREEAQRSSELFVEHFRGTYGEFPDLPVWVAAEVMSFGAASQMLRGMLRDDQIAIARRYGVHSTVLASWMHHLVYVRNVCAHHARLWGRQFTIMPELPHRVPAWQPPYLPSRDRLFVTLLVLNTLLRAVPIMRPFAVAWRRRVEAHFDTLPSVPNALGCLGMNERWKQHPLWR